MSKLTNIAAKATVRQYAQGAAQNMVKNTIGNFLAPGVDVALMSGNYKVYTEKNRYRVLNTRRAPGQSAVQIGWDASDESYNCAPNAIDCPVDIAEQMAEETIENAFKEAADLVAEAAALSHEVDVITKATSAVSSSTITLGADTNLISDFDDAVLDIMKASGFGGSLRIRFLWGATAWKKAKNHKSIIDALSDTKLKVPSLELMKDLIIGTPENRCTFSVKDTAPEGKARNLDFLLSNKVLIFVANDNPTRRDPSFMKTFRLSGGWMKSGTYQSPDGRAEIAKMDWSEDVKVTNSLAAKLITIN
jgi:hypothetical protein